MTRISAFVITCDREQYLRAVLKRLRFVDEIILVDKGNIEASAFVYRLVDRYERAPWTPVVEDTRAYAESLCSHEWIICLDDDEILSREAGAHLRAAAEAAFGDVFYCPIHHHIMGRWHPDAFPDMRPVMYRKGMLQRSTAVHGGVLPAGRAVKFQDGPVYIDHLSHPDVATWIEKANRYTSQPDRVSADLAPRIHGDIAAADDPYLLAVRMLRTAYDVIDGLKLWEATQPDGHEAFRKICDEVMAE